MHYHNILQALKYYCIKNARQYRHAYIKEGLCGIGYIKYHILDGILYWLQSLTDKIFKNADHCKQEIMALIHVKSQQFYTHLPHPAAQSITHHILESFYAHVKALPPDVWPPAVGYERTLLGEEKQAIADKLKQHWHYAGGRFRPPKDKPAVTFLYANIAKEEDFICQTLLAPRPVIRYGQGLFEPYQCALTDEIDFRYKGLNTVYTDADMSFLIAITDEQTITFAGERLVSFIQNTIKAPGFNFSVNL